MGDPVSTAIVASVIGAGATIASTNYQQEKARKLQREQMDQQEKLRKSEAEKIKLREQELETRKRKAIQGTKASVYGGREETILTSVIGVPEQANTSGKTLLGV